MRKGDYVRTEDGIKKVLKYKYNERYENGHCVWFDNKDCGILFTDEEVNKMKPSPNIIDLIEVGDLLYVDISPDDCGGIVVPTIPMTKFELDILIKKILLGVKELKGIITKEQLESVVFKI